uniref:Ig-like domain-containing protein n=1 Tax=Neogobius melanostomus TaxID=47308 RepID=A0A8C6U835_9GOBI
RRLRLYLLLLLILLTIGFLSSNTFRCVFNSTDPNDIQYIISGWFNKLELFRFDSKLGRFVGYTEFGVKVAQNANNNTAYLEQLRHDKYRVCVYNIDFWYNCILSKSVEPYGVIHTTPSGGSERVLVCSVYGFYPKDITVTWTNNNQQITTGVINSETMPDRDWTYQLHTHLEYSPSTVPHCPPGTVPQILSPRYCPPLSPRCCSPGTGLTLTRKCTFPSVAFIYLYYRLFIQMPRSLLGLQLTIILIID